jgi:hypothetical protein
VPYAAAALLPAAFVLALTAVLACVVAGLFAGGLRAVARSAGLRRALPITDRALSWRPFSPPSRSCSPPDPPKSQDSGHTSKKARR